MIRLAKRGGVRLRRDERGVALGPVVLVEAAEAKEPIVKIANRTQFAARAAA